MIVRKPRSGVWSDTQERLFRLVFIAMTNAVKSVLGINKTTMNDDKYSIPETAAQAAWGAYVRVLYEDHDLPKWEFAPSKLRQAWIDSVKTVNGLLMRDIATANARVEIADGQAAELDEQIKTLTHIIETQRVAIELLKAKLECKSRGDAGLGSTGKS